MTNNLELIKNRKNLYKELFAINDVDRDDNSYFRTLSLYFANDQSYYQFLCKLIYNTTKIISMILKTFFF